MYKIQSLPAEGGRGGKSEGRKKEFCMINGILGLVAVLVKHNWS